MIANRPRRAHRPIRILMTADAIGGVWQYAVDLTRSLVRRRAKVLLATMGARPSTKQKRQLLPQILVAESDYALEWMPNPWSDVDAASQWLLDLASKFQPEIIHLNGYFHANLPWRKPAVVVAHSCVLSWWRAVHGCAPPEEWSEYKRRVVEGLAHASAIVCPSRFMAGALETEYGVAREKLRVIHNFSRAPQADVTRKTELILAAGRMWDKAKNLALLEQIAPALKWEIRLASGNLSHSEALQEMARASIFAHPALYEPFGLSVLEAARRRCCLVLSDIPSLKELWAGAAVFLDPRDPAQWVSEIARLIEDPREREKLANLACARAGTFRAETAVSDYWKLYDSLLAPNRSANAEAAA